MAKKGFHGCRGGQGDLVGDGRWCFAVRLARCNNNPCEPLEKGEKDGMALHTTGLRLSSLLLGLLDEPPRQGSRLPS